MSRYGKPENWPDDVPFIEFEGVRQVVTEDGGLVHILSDESVFVDLAMPRMEAALEGIDLDDHKALVARMCEVLDDIHSVQDSIRSGEL